MPDFHPGVDNIRVGMVYNRTATVSELDGLKRYIPNVSDCDSVTTSDLVKWFVRGILAGICISMGGVVLLGTMASVGAQYKWVGACLFAIGLFTVIHFGFNLYTGKIGYVLENDRVYLVQVALGLIGNLVGCLIIGYAFQFDGAVTMCEAKIDGLDLSDPYSIFVNLMKGVMCGMLMFIAVDYHKTKGSFLATFVAVPVFIMAGFEHSIADMFYFSSAMMWDMDAVIFILIIIIGNAIGGMLIPAYRLYINGERKTDKVQ